MKKIRIVAISDTHENHAQLQIPHGDILIHSGDFTRRGDINAVIEFNIWLGTLPHKHKIVIAGNHDLIFEQSPGVAESLLSNAIYLKDSSIVIEGVKFYGSPWQPEFNDWAFGLPRGEEELQRAWRNIPDDTGVLITHTPPADILDYCYEKRGPVHIGCSLLAYRISQLKLLQLHLFGHSHDSYGSREINGVRFGNAASVNRMELVTNPPLVFDMDEDGVTWIEDRSESI